MAASSSKNDSGTTNPLVYISTVEPLSGNNYGSWREKIEISLALLDIDLALIEPCPTEPVVPVMGEGESEDAFKQRMLNHAPIVQKYDTDRAKWESSNRKCLMVIKSLIVEAIRGAIPVCTTATEYLQRVENHFTGSSKAYASSLIKSLVTMKYNGGGVRDHILKMSGITLKLKKMDLVLPDEFLVHLIFASLPSDFDAFVVNYNSLPETWNIEKLIAMCVQEEDRPKTRGDSANYVKNKRRINHSQNVASPKAQGKASQSDPHSRPSVEVDRDTCRWCKQKGHFQKDCPEFLKHLINKGLPYEENASKRRKMHYSSKWC